MTTNIFHNGGSFMQRQYRLLQGLGFLCCLLLTLVLTGEKAFGAIETRDEAGAMQFLQLLKDYRSSMLMYYMDSNIWPMGKGNWKKSLDLYMPTKNNPVKSVLFVEDKKSKTRYLVLEGLGTSELAQSGVQNILAGIAGKTAIYSAPGQRYQSGLSLQISVYQFDSKGKMTLFLEFVIPKQLSLSNSGLSGAQKQNNEARAEAVKIVNLLRNYKSATLLYYTDWNLWPTPEGNWLKSLDQYTDRRLDPKLFKRILFLEKKP